MSSAIDLKVQGLSRVAFDGLKTLPLTSRVITRLHTLCCLLVVATGSCGMELFAAEAAKQWQYWHSVLWH